MVCNYCTVPSPILARQRTHRSREARRASARRVFLRCFPPSPACNTPRRSESYPLRRSLSTYSCSRSNVDICSTRSQNHWNYIQFKYRHLFELLPNLRTRTDSNKAKCRALIWLVEKLLGHLDTRTGSSTRIHWPQSSVSFVQPRGRNLNFNISPASSKRSDTRT